MNLSFAVNRHDHIVRPYENYVSDFVPAGQEWKTVKLWAPRVGLDKNTFHTPQIYLNINQRTHYIPQGAQSFVWQTVEKGIDVDNNPPHIVEWQQVGYSNILLVSTFNTKMDPLPTMPFSRPRNYWTDPWLAHPRGDPNESPPILTAPDNIAVDFRPCLLPGVVNFLMAQFDRIGTPLIELMAAIKVHSKAPYYQLFARVNAQDTNAWKKNAYASATAHAYGMAPTAYFPYTGLWKRRNRLGPQSGSAAPWEEGQLFGDITRATFQQSMKADDTGVGQWCCGFPGVINRNTVPAHQNQEQYARDHRPDLLPPDTNSWNITQADIDAARAYLIESDDICRDFLLNKGGTLSYALGNEVSDGTPIVSAYTDFFSPSYTTTPFATNVRQTSAESFCTNYETHVYNLLEDLQQGSEGVYLRGGTHGAYNRVLPACSWEGVYRPQLAFSNQFNYPTSSCQETENVEGTLYCQF